MENQDDSSVFLKKVKSLLQALGIDYKNEMQLQETLSKDYKYYMHNIIGLKKSKHSNTINSREKGKEESKTEELLHTEINLYKTVIEQIGIEIEQIEKQAANIKDKAIIKHLSKSLSKLRSNLEKEQKKLKLIQKKLSRIINQHDKIKTLKKLKSRQEKLIKESIDDREVTALSKFLLPGKWLKSYKDSIDIQIKQQSKALEKTSKDIDALKKGTSPPPKPLKTIAKKHTNSLGSNKKEIKNKSNDNPNKDKIEKRDISSSKKLSQKPLPIKVAKTLLSNINKSKRYNTNSNTGPSTTPKSKTRSTIQNQKNKQFVRKKKLL
ncbi:MAG: hypothetical protein K0T99_02250 [Alphaproteobacteria bacterium]|nr:hypothetical protein [Alphaproteobacteria bacterium]